MEAVTVETVVERETRYAQRSARYAVGEEILMLMRDFLGDRENRDQYRSQLTRLSKCIKNSQEHLDDERLTKINTLLDSLQGQEINRKDFLHEQFRRLLFPKIDMTSISQPVFAHVFPRLTLRALTKFEMESDANKKFVEKYFQSSSVRPVDMQQWFSEALNPFQGYSRYSHAFSCFYASLTAQDNQTCIQDLGEGLVHLLRVPEDLDLATVSFLHRYYQFHGGQASLSKIQDKAHELNKRKFREKIVLKGIEYAGYTTYLSGTYGIVGWIGFGCCCPGSVCCCGFNIALSAVCGGSTAAGLAFNAEKMHSVVRSRCCDVDYDLEEVHPAAQDFASQLPPVIAMDVEPGFQSMEIEDDQPERPSCFQGVMNFFRSQQANNNIVEEVQVRREPRP